ncbi:hypothetical protein [Candidatus Parabeggiatoa sp. HSG14]|uniref:hypothetical protein n=1 Tax=Candidatus Parabeggiatoa sp. HSG14 TaxID=3055593 RepID=UPI0025A87C88|nr:hypothetical protein [Thiotrichales bacterium HSG14]
MKNEKWKITIKISILILLSFLTVGCFSPAIVTERLPECQLMTKELKLVFSEEQTQALVAGALETMLNSAEHCNSPECLLIAPLGFFAISVTSMIVSGSIVVVGNSIHWIEKEGRCKNSTTRTIVNNLVDSVKFIGGQTIQSTNDLIGWFKQQLIMDSPTYH